MYTLMGYNARSCVCGHAVCGSNQFFEFPEHNRILDNVEFVHYYVRSLTWPGTTVMAVLCFGLFLDARSTVSSIQKCCTTPSALAPHTVGYCTVSPSSAHCRLLYCQP